MPTLPFLAAAAIPTLCVPSDLTNPFVIPGVFAGVGWICPLMMAVLPIFRGRMLSRARPGYLRLWLRPAVVLVAFGMAILAADGWIWLQALHFIPWCTPPGAFSNAAKDAQLARVYVAGSLGFFGILVGVCLAALGYVAARQRLGLGRTGRAGPGAAPVTHPAGGA